jgi:hypothetical protein
VDATAIGKAIVANDQLVGCISCFENAGQEFVGITEIDPRTGAAIRRGTAAAGNTQVGK